MLGIEIVTKWTWFELETEEVSLLYILKYKREIFDLFSAITYGSYFLYILIKAAYASMFVGNKTLVILSLNHQAYLWILHRGRWLFFLLCYLLCLNPLIEWG